MWYKFKKGLSKGILRIKRLQVAWYDMENDGSCFDESWIENKEDNDKIYEKMGLYLTYVDMNEEADKQKRDRSRVFVHMDNGDVYELKMKKLSKEEFAKCNNFFGSNKEE